MQHRCTDGSVSSDGRLLVSLPLVWRARICVLALCSLLFLFSPPRAVADFSGPVVSVLDGDTIEVLHNAHAERIRLNGIDCQEKGQAYGYRAKQATATMVFGKEVLLQPHGLMGRLISWRWRAWGQPASLSVGHGFLGVK